MQRHSTFDNRHPAAGIRHSSPVTRHLSLVACHSLFCIALAALAAVAARAETTDSYVRDGLLACWDGIENAGTAANWIDVVGGKSFALSNVTVAADSIVFKGNKTSYGVLDEAGTTATFGAATNGTIEIVYASATGTGSQFILQSSSGSGIAYGFYKTSTLIACNASAPTATFTSGTATNTAAVRYTSAKPASYVVNGAELTNGGNNYWGGANTTTVIGNRTSHADYHFNGAIYCIRLYDRQLSDAEIAANLAVDHHRFLEGRAVYGAVSVAQTNGVWYATVELLKGSGDIDLHVVSPQGATNVFALSNGVVAAPATFTTAIPGIAADPVYSAFASIASGAETNFTRVANIFNSPVSIEVTADATPTTPGVFTVSRPAVAGATNMPLTVAFTLSGTAVAGTHYAPLPETVTIPAGAASATVEVATLAQATAATSLTLSLSGDNHLPGNPASATMAVNSVFFTGDWFVAKDGDDRNSGASRAEAKATIQAAYACLTNIPAARVGNRLVICDGEWEVSESFVLSNGWSLVSEHGRAYTTLKPTVAISLFTLASADSSVSGFTADLDITYPKGSEPALLAAEPVGTISDCTVRNLKPAAATSAVRLVTISASAAEVFIRNCSFENCSVSYRSALFWIQGGGKIHFDRCSFTDCHGRNPSGNQYYNYGMIFISSSGCTLRNCLFKRCTVYGNYSDTFNQSSVVCISKNCSAVVENCTFVSCSALGPSKGGALACATVLNASDMAGTAKNCLAVNCKNAFGPAGLMHGFTYSHCAQETALDGEGNVVVNDSNTTWQNPLNDSYFPESGPAVDGGELLDWMGTATDLRGNARVIGSAPDIGCHEYPGYPRNTYYVAKDGDDANSGLTRAEAKATLAAGYALLHGEDETLMICDGIWDYAPDGSLVLSNGWTLTSEHGAEATTLKATQSGYLFSQPEGRTLVEGITFDLANVAFGTDVVSAPQGVISGCVFSNSNHRTGWASARMMCLTSGTPLVTNCLFRDCRNTFNGVSVIWISGGSAKIVDCSFVDCNSGTSGTALGAIYCYGGSTTMRNCLFLRCKSRGCSQGTYAPNGGHIVAVGRAATLFADNCSFIDCTITGSEKAGALGTTKVGSYAATLVATNCFAYGNVNALGPANLMTNIFEGCSATFSHCASDYLLPGDGNVVLTDTNFNCARAGRGDHTPTRGPTLDAGVPLPWMTGAKDILGRDRVVGAAPDIGCFEYDNRAFTRLLLR